MEIKAQKTMEIETAVEFDLIKCRFRAYLLAAGAVDAVARRAATKECDQLQTELEQYKHATTRAETLFSESLTRREGQLKAQIDNFKHDEQEEFEEQSEKLRCAQAETETERDNLALEVIIYGELDKKQQRVYQVADNLTTALAAREGRVRPDRLEAERIFSLFVEKERVVSAREDSIQHNQATLAAQKALIDAYQAGVFHIKRKLNKSSKRLKAKSLRVRASMHKGLGMIRDSEARVNRESAETKRGLEESLAHERNVMRAEVDEKNSTIANASMTNSTLTVVVASLTRENASLKIRLMNKMKATRRGPFKPKQEYPLSWAQPG
ncbi:hypothetical protein O988_01908 [Pseudogymnoascus sp. VKM F-3808]|nr:hypothetical protein O988_01908 [Pseudogymnoascus sp. VKM F-3808]